jgi:Domain of unknown function (DUF1931)
MPVFGATRFERFFRAAAGLDVDKNDVKRFQEFLNAKLYDMILAAEITAAANDRDIIYPQDLPITKGLQESMHAFRAMEQEIELAPILEQLAAYPPPRRALTIETEQRLPMVVGGLGLAMARTLTTIDPELKNPQSDDWERVFRVFDLLL